MSQDIITNPEFEYSAFIFNWWVLMSIISVFNLVKYYEIYNSKTAEKGDSDQILKYKWVMKNLAGPYVF